MKKRLRTATGPTACPKPGTRHSPFSSGSHPSVLVTVAFQADLSLCLMTVLRFCHIFTPCYWLPLCNRH